jgi:hypothetical protein
MEKNSLNFLNKMQEKKGTKDLLKTLNLRLPLKDIHVSQIY